MVRRDGNPRQVAALSAEILPFAAGSDKKTSVNELAPALKWAGGKRWLVPLLQDLYRPHVNKRLVEPFVGGLAVSLGLRPTKALLNDINKHLIAFYRNLQHGLVLPNDFLNESSYYYAARSRFNSLVSSGNHESKEASELFYYLNRTCYNGLCRFNLSGFYNVPFGRYKNLKYRANLLEYVDVLKPYEFSACHFGEITTGPDDFVYADPPYDVEFTSYSSERFLWRDQLELAEWLALRTGPVVASNQATDRVCSLYRELGFDVYTLPGPRRISCTGDRTHALEMIAIKGLE